MGSWALVPAVEGDKWFVVGGNSWTKLGLGFVGFGIRKGRPVCSMDVVYCLPS